MSGSTKGAGPGRLRRMARRAGELLLRRRPEPDPVAALARMIEASGLFDAAYYRAQNPDVAATGADPAEHYLRHGAAEGRDPHPLFSTRFYLQHSPDAGSDNPLLHYLEVGASEPFRPVSPRFDPTFYLGWIGPRRTHPIPLVDYVRRTDWPAPPHFDGTAFPSVAVVRSPEELATALKPKRTRHLLFLPPDVHLLPGWLGEALGTLERVPRLGLVGGKRVHPAGILLGAGGVFADGGAQEVGCGEPHTEPEYCYARPVDFCPAPFVVSREAWEATGCERLNGEEALAGAEPARRLRAAGFGVWYQPLAVSVLPGVELPPAPDPSLSCPSCSSCQNSSETVPSGPRVLFIDGNTPTPDQDSGSRTSTDLIAALQDVGFRATFLPDDLAAVPRYTADLQRQGVECLYGPFTPSVGEHLRDHGRRYDLVVIFRAPLASKYLFLAREYAPRAKVVFHTVDLHYLREQREAELAGDPLRARHAAVNRARELGMVLAADCTVVVSDFEKELLARELPTAYVHCLPYIMDVAGCRTPFADRRDVIFVGGYRHPPNIDAARYFAEEVLPRVRAQVPGLRFRVIGSHPTPEVRALAALDGVEVVGPVPDLAPYFESCRLSVAPLRYGAGIKGKVVTSLSFGVPCVLTPVAAEGMGLADGREALVADGPEAFAEAVVRLYADEPLWRRVSQASLDFVETHYSRSAGRRHVRDILARVGLPLPEPAAASPIDRAA